MAGEFEHRAHYHSHEHGHAAYVHGHDVSEEQELDDHPRTAHIHDHASPAGGGL